MNLFLKKVKIRCVASIYSAYYQGTEVVGVRLYCGTWPYLFHKVSLGRRRRRGRKSRDKEGRRGEGGVHTKQEKPGARNFNTKPVWRVFCLWPWIHMFGEQVRRSNWRPPPHPQAHLAPPSLSCNQLLLLSHSSSSSSGQEAQARQAACHPSSSSLFFTSAWVKSCCGRQSCDSGTPSCTALALIIWPKSGSSSRSTKLPTDQEWPKVHSGSKWTDRCVGAEERANTVQWEWTKLWPLELEGGEGGGSGEEEGGEEGGGGEGGSWFRSKCDSILLAGGLISSIPQSGAAFQMWKWYDWWILNCYSVNFKRINFQTLSGSQLCVAGTPCKTRFGSTSLHWGWEFWITHGLVAISV